MSSPRLTKAKTRELGARREDRLEVRRESAEVRAAKSHSGGIDERLHKLEANNEVGTNGSNVELRQGSNELLKIGLTRL